MDVFSMELGIRLSLVKTLEFRGGGSSKTTTPPNRYATGLMYVHSCLRQTSILSMLLSLSMEGMLFYRWI
jgi:hypothetical protein